MLGISQKIFTLFTHYSSDYSSFFVKIGLLSHYAVDVNNIFADICR